MKGSSRDGDPLQRFPLAESAVTGSSFSLRYGYISGIYLIRRPILFLTKVTPIEGSETLAVRQLRASRCYKRRERSTTCYEVSITSKNWIEAAGLAAILSR